MSIPVGTDGSDAKKLEGRPEGEEGKFLPREFFWDSVALYVVSAIVGLAAIDVVTEFLRGSSVSCYAPDGVTVSEKQEEYINNFCSASLPMTEYFPAFIVVHGILIAIPHYLWLNHYGGNFDFFFTQASLMDRTREEKTGEYSDKNWLIMHQLLQAFSTYKQNWMYILYILKLVLQWFISTIGFFVAVLYFTDFDDAFYCPRNFNSSSNVDEFWPLNEQVRCVFTSLRLYSTIRIADLILIALLVLCYFWAIIWCASTHSTELGAEQVAEFSFQSGISPEHYVHKFRLARLCCKPCKGYIRKFFTSVPSPFGPGPRIMTNLDFLLLKLFRTDSGLGHVFREMQILLRINELDNDDQRRTHLHKRQQKEEEMKDNDLIEPEEITADLQWTFKKEADEDGLFDADYNSFSPDRTLEIPNSIRGAIVGFSARAPLNGIALYVTFGSPSLGIASALSRVFDRVGVVNFSPYYHTTEPNKLVTTKIFTSNIVNVLCPEDILSSEVKNSNQLLSGMEPVWVRVGSGIALERAPKTDFIVVGPIDKKPHKSTATLFLTELSEAGRLKDNCVLLTIYPTMIAGKETGSEFHKCTPPGLYFGPFKQRVKMNLEEGPLDWQPSDNQAKEEGQQMSTFEFDRVVCGDSSCTFLFKVYKYPKEEEEERQSTAAATSEAAAKHTAAATTVPKTDPSTMV